MVIGIILGIVIAVLAIVAFVVTGVCAENGHSVGVGVSVVVGIALVIAFLIVPFSFHTVQTGQVAVVKHLGEAREVKSAGTHYDFWMTNTYVKYDTKVQNVDIVAAAYSSDAQTMDVQMTLQYQIVSDKALDIMAQYGSLDILQNRIQSIATEKTKAVLSSYKAMDIIAQRAQMSPAVETAIKDAIGTEYFVNVVAVVLTNIDFSDAFEQAVEDKMIAEQAKLKAEYENQTKIAQAQAEAEAKLKAAQAEIEIAKAAAEAKIVAAEADRRAQIEIARAEAESVQLKSIEVARALGFAITENVITAEDGSAKIEYTIDFEGKSADEIAVIGEYLKYMEYLAKWDGELPGVVADGSAVVVTP